MLTLNKVDITGKILSIEEDGSGEIITISQNVAGKIPTQFPIYIPAKLLPEVKLLDLKIGEALMVTNAMLYQIEEKWKLKIENINQAQRIEFEKKEDMDLGAEEASEKFI